MKRNITEYQGTAAWYAYEIIRRCSLRDNLKAAAAKHEFTKAEQNEILCIAVDVCKTCAMAKLAADVARAAMGTGIIWAGEGGASVEDIADCYIGQADPFFFSEEEFFTNKE